MAASSQVPLAKRQAEAQEILVKYPDRVPIICERSARSDLPQISKRKFLVPSTMHVGEFKYVIHKHIQQTAAQEGKVGPDQTIYLFVAGTSPRTTAYMSEVYDAHRDADGFLYITYGAENTLGEESLAVRRDSGAPRVAEEAEASPAVAPLVAGRRRS